MWKNDFKDEAVFFYEEDKGIGLVIITKLFMSLLLSTMLSLGEHWEI